jgi:hypothetical protein
MPGLEDQAEVFCTTASPTLLHLTFQIAPNRRGQEAMAVREKPWAEKPWELCHQNWVLFLCPQKHRPALVGSLWQTEQAFDFFPLLARGLAG